MKQCATLNPVFPDYRATNHAIKPPASQGARSKRSGEGTEPRKRPQSDRRSFEESPHMARPRKAGPRTPSGQLSRADSEPRYSPAAIKRLADGAIAAASDPRLGSAVGLMLLRGKLTTRQAAAAWRYAEVRADYLRAVEAPRCKTASLERGQRGEEPDEASAAGEALDKARQRSERRFIRVSAILDGQGAQARQAVEALCCQDIQPQTHEALLAVRTALDALAAHFATG